MAVADAKPPGFERRRALRPLLDDEIHVGHDQLILDTTHTAQLDVALGEKLVG
eukprot:COSAG06_NODE_2697_length_6436_cov_8.420546_2_plen_53_part_00